MHTGGRSGQNHTFRDEFIRLMQALGVLAGTADLVADPPGNPPRHPPGISNHPGTVHAFESATPQTSQATPVAPSYHPSNNRSEVLRGAVVEDSGGDRDEVYGAERLGLLGDAETDIVMEDCAQEGTVREETAGAQPSS